MKKIIAVCICGLFLIGCQPEVGSDKWCKNMDDKDKGDWTVNEATDYAKHCIFK